MQNNFEAAKYSALRLIKFRMRSYYELQDRLEKKHFSIDIIKQVLDSLGDLGYIDDLAFATSWVNSRLQSKPRSKKMIAYELKKKGIQNNLIEQSLSDLDAEKEEQIAREIATQRFSKLHGLKKETQKRRLNNYLERRGFSTCVCFKIINELV